MNVIAAQTTARGRGAIAVIEVVGSGAREVVGALFDRALPGSNRVAFGRLRDGEPLDEVVIRARDPAGSFTGEETVEIQCHGGSVCVDSIFRALVRRGVERAESDALLRRAFENRRIDGVQGEAYRLLSTAKTERAARMLLDQANGALSRALREGREVLGTAPLGIALADPRRVVLAGLPNAGKSTLFNALVEEDRVIVSEIPGTTRDPVGELIAIEDVPIWIYDTAGVGGERELDLLEQLAVDRTREMLKRADLILLLYDVTVNGHDDERRFEAECRRPIVRVAAKGDLDGEAPGVRVSGKTKAGISGLRDEILRALGLRVEIEPGAPAVFTERQREEIKNGRAKGLLESLPPLC